MPSSADRPALLLPCAAAAAQSFAFTAHGPLVPLIIADAGLTPTQAGLLTTAAFVTAGVLSVPLGALTDRIGAKHVQSLAMALLVVATAAFALAPSLPLMLVARAAAGVSLATVFIAGGGYVNRFWTGERQFFAQGLHGGATQLGIGAAILTLPAVGAAQGWRTGAGVAAGVAAVMLVLWQIRARPTPSTPSRPPLSLVIGNGAIWCLGFVHASTFGLAIIVGAWIATYLVDEFRLPLALAGLLGSSGLIVGAVGRPVGGIIVARGAHPRTMILGTLAMATLALVLVGWPARPLAVALGGVVMLGVATALAYAPVVSLGARAAPAAPGAALGLVGLAATPGVVVGAPLVGALLSSTGSFTVPFVALAALPALAFLLSMRLPR